MSNLTDFFSAGGAGGGIGQTITVGDMTYTNARPISDIKIYYIYQNTNLSYNNYNFRSFDSNEPGWYHANGGGGASDWVTVADITSSTNGGAIYGAQCYFDNSAQDHTNRVVEMRITIDGSSTSWTTASRNCYNLSMAYLGPLGNCYINFQSSSNSYGAPGTIDGFSAMFAGSAPSTRAFTYDVTTGSYENDADANQGAAWWYKEPSSLWGIRAQPFVYFSSTCKVEMKVNRDNSEDKFYTGIKLF
jgi:hypothetical protein